MSQQVLVFKGSGLLHFIYLKYYTVPESQSVILTLGCQSGFHSFTFSKAVISAALVLYKVQNHAATWWTVKL